MNRTFLLIVLLIVSAAGLLALALNTKTPEKTTTPVSIVQTTLSMSSPIASTSGLLNSDINVDTNANTVSAIQIELSYDPKDLGSVDILPGSFFTNPIELFKKIDTVNGRVSYAIGVTLDEKGISGKGNVATLVFSKLRTSGTTTVSFLPKSLVTSPGVSQSVLKSATGLSIDLSK